MVLNFQQLNSVGLNTKDQQVKVEISLNAVKEINALMNQYELN